MDEHGNEGESGAHADAVYPAKEPHRDGVVRMIDTQGARCAEEAVQQVVRERDHANRTQGHIPTTAADGEHQRREIFAAVSIERDITEPDLIPEIAKMNDEEAEDDRSEQTHLAGVSFAAGTAATVLVACANRAMISERNEQREEPVGEDAAQ